MDGSIFNTAAAEVEAALTLSGEEILRDIEELRRELSRSFGIPVRCLFGSFELVAESQVAEARAEELLARVLTVGERQALSRLGVVPVIGGTTGDLYLVRKSLAYNMLRYGTEVVPRRWLRFLPPKAKVVPRMGCVTRARPAPLADLLISILTGLRYAEDEVTVKALWWPHRTLSREADRERGYIECALEPGLRALAECRCESQKMLEAVARAAEASGGLV